MADFDFTNGGGGAVAAVSGGSGGGGGISATASAFVTHMFSPGSRQGQAEMWNAAQYGALAVLPIAALNRGVNWATPEPSEDAHSFVLLLEVILQAVVLLLGFVLVHRLVTFVPTYSGFGYDRLNLAGAALAVLAILLSLKSKINVKVSILAERASDLWTGNGGGGDAKQQKQQQQQQRRPVVAAAAPPLPARQGAVALPLAGVQPGGSLMR